MSRRTFLDIYFRWNGAEIWLINGLTYALNCNNMEFMDERFTMKQRLLFAAGKNGMEKTPYLSASNFE